VSLAPPLLRGLHLVEGEDEVLLVERLVAGEAGVAAAPADFRGGSAYLEGLLVSLSNPKVLLFLGAFLPQFIDPTSDGLGQLMVLAVVFVAVLASVDVAYTIAVARARTGLQGRWMGMLDGAAGILLLLGGLMLATVRRP
jgi:homoserine/homoserine lactone efflux protein